MRKSKIQIGFLLIWRDENMKKIRCIIIAFLCCTFVLFGQTMVFADTSVPEADPENPQRLTISEAGTYTLTGSMQGTVYVDPGAGDVRLILNNVDITSVNEPAIMAVSGDLLTVEIAECTCNRISDSKDNTEEAAIVSSVNTVFEGTGCLQINGTKKYGVLTRDADLTLKSGTYLVVSEDSAIKADGSNAGSLDLQGGCLYVNTNADPAMHVRNININGGKWISTKETVICNICGCCGNCRSGCCGKTHCAVCCKDKCKKPECGTEGSCCAPTTDTPGPVVEGQTKNSAGELTADTESAVNIVLSDESGTAEISEAGTYIVTGTSGNGGISIAQGTRGVVLILKDLDLTSSSGAALHIYSDAEVQIVIEGEVTITDATVPDDPESYDGAAIKVEDNSDITVTGDGTLKVEGNAKDGIAAGTDSSLVIEGDMEINVQAKNDGVRSKGDVAVNKGKVTIKAGNDGIHSDKVLTVGEKDGSGPEIKVTECKEGIEGAVVNIQGGKVDIKASEDGIEAELNDESSDSEDQEAANTDLEPSVNITGGDVKVEADASAIDSDGNVNLIDGKAEIHSGSESSCIDHDDELYISDDFELECDCKCESESCESDC